MSLTIKIQKGEELRRLTLSRSQASFKDLQEKITSLFNLPSSSSSSSSLAIRYVDEDGDLITLSTDLELAELLSSTSSSLRLQVIPSESPSPSLFSSSVTSTSPSSEKLNEPTPPSEEKNEIEKEKQAEKQAEKEAPKEEGKEEAPPKEEAQKDEETEAPAPGLEEILEGLSGLGTRVQQLFEENPQIQDDLEKLTEQLSSFLTATFSEPSPPSAFHPSNLSSSSSSSSAFASEAPFPPFPFLFRGFPFPGGHPAGFGGAFNHRGPQRHPHPSFCGTSRPPFAQPSASDSPSSSSSSGRRCPAAESSPCASFFQEKRRIIEEKLEELESMGFIDRELNLHLLIRSRGDLATVVDELEKISAQFAF